MSNLAALITRLESLFLDPYQLALSDNLKQEAFRTSLAELNSVLCADFRLEGLDGASQSTLPEDHVPALLREAAATVLEAVSFHSRSSYSNLPVEHPDITAWSRYLRQERDQLLNKLRLRSLTQSTTPAWGTWEMEDD